MITIVILITTIIIIIVAITITIMIIIVMIMIIIVNPLNRQEPFIRLNLFEQMLENKRARGWGGGDRRR